MSYFDALFNGTVSARVVTVTPEIARQILNDHNRGNRPIKPNVVKKYARMMSIGDWRMTPETISISKSGRLLNGQHRLLAVEMSGVSVDYLFAYGFEDDVFQVLDRGAVRTLSDALSIEKKMAQAAALLLRLCTGAAPGTTSDGDVMRASERISETHAALMAHCSSNAKVFSSAPFRLACVARVMSGEDQDRCFGLYRDLVLGHTEKLPPVGHAAIRAVLSGRLFGGGGHVQPTNACVAWEVFGIDAKHKSKISVKYNPLIADKIVKATGYEHA